VSGGKYKKIDTADTVVEEYCFIGSNAVIMMGAHIGHHSIIAAGCIVKEHTKIPPYSIVAGIPGKITGSSKKYKK
jgi:acetyltransferase-like isoleucine patch superfamily enzyme